MSKKTAIKKQASRDKKIECAFCHGSGIQPRTVASRCSACGGKGKLVFNNPIISCPSCQGKGTAGTSLLACINCRGIGVVEQEESIREVEEEPLKEPLKKNYQTWKIFVGTPERTGSEHPTRCPTVRDCSELHGENRSRRHIQNNRP